MEFRYEQGIEGIHDLADPKACGWLWDHLTGYEHELLSDDPVRIRVTAPGERGTLHLTLDGDLDVVEVFRSEG